MLDTSTRSTFRERARQLREAEILGAASALFGERGFHAVSMDEVAERVGISKATLYQHFPSKDELALQVIGRQMDRSVERLEQAQTEPGTPTERLAAVLRFVIDLRYDGGCPEVHLGDGEIGRLFKTRPEFAQRIQRIRALMDTLIDAAKAAGEIDPALPNEVVVGSFYSLAVAHNYRSFLRREGLAVADLGRFMTRLFLNGVRPPAGA